MLSFQLLTRDYVNKVTQIFDVDCEWSGFGLRPNVFCVTFEARSGFVSP